MIFSDKTLTVLKNFASVNQSIVFKPGKVLKTVDFARTIIAVAKIDDEIPADAVVYDASRFLSTMSLYESPEVEFGEKAFTISQGRRRTNYAYADIATVIAPPSIDFEKRFPKPDVTVDVSWTDLQSVIKASGVMQLPNVVFVGENGKVLLRATDEKCTPGADKFDVEIGETEDEFAMIIKAEYLKVLPMDYTVSLSSAGASRFVGEYITYFIAVEEKSTYTKG